MHLQMSEFYKKILTEMRHDSEYFRISFYGLGFPELLRNKTFIYRGKEYEQLSSFSSRILNQHPRAEILQTLEKPTPEIINGEGQYIQINKVEPIANEKNRKLQDISQTRNIPQSIVKYYKTNIVDEFKFSRPFRDTSKNWMSSTDADNVGNLWLERTVMKTLHPLPGILKWFPVNEPQIYTVSMKSFILLLN
jgi:hypothetical protein